MIAPAARPTPKPHPSRHCALAGVDREETAVAVRRAVAKLAVRRFMVVSLRLGASPQWKTFCNEWNARLVPSTRYFTIPRSDEGPEPASILKIFAVVLGRLTEL